MTTALEYLELKMIRKKGDLLLHLHDRLKLDLCTLNNATVKPDTVIEKAFDSLHKGEQALAKDLVPDNPRSMEEYQLDLNVVQVSLNYSTDYLTQMGLVPPRHIKVLSSTCKQGRLIIEYEDLHN